MKRKIFPWGWFLFGLGSQLQLWGTSLCFTELFAIGMTPMLLSSEWPYLRRNGLTTLFWLCAAVFAGCCISCCANHTAFSGAIRGLSATGILVCAVVVSHWMLRKNMNGFKWFIVGSAISFILSTFIFRQSVEINQLAGGVADDSATQAIMSGPIYWIGRLNGVLTAPAKGWYLQCPILYSVGAPLFLAGFAMMTSVSGRSAAINALASAVLVFIGGKKQRTIKRVGRYFWLFLLLGIIGAFVAKNAYSYAATHNWLGEDARKKYESQTKGNKSMLALLMGGRIESFCGLFACLDKPIVGFGPWAMDYGGYVANFFAKYGTPEDADAYFDWQRRNPGRVKLIPAHSHLVSFWLWYGVFGLFFWFYVIFVFLRFLRQDCWAVPQWYMWLAAGIPEYFWGIFFSPFGNRVGSVMFIVACLMARAVRRGRQQLPFEMIKQIEKTK